MTFALTDAAPSVYVGLADTAFTAPGSVTWTDLTSRVRSCETQSDSRDDRTADFSPGQATIVLDNSDRMLDPTWSGSLVYQAGSEGLPGSPVKVVANGMTVWYGVLAVSGECWQVDRTRGAESVCTLNAVTLTSFLASVAMPSSPWAAGIIGMAPDYWIRGDAASTSLSAGDSLPDTITAGVNATVAGSGTLTQATSLVSDDDNPAMAPGSGTYVKCLSADLATSWSGGGTKTQMAAATIWQSSEITSGTDNVMRLEHAGTGHYRWSVTADSAGQLILTMYNTTGTALSYDVAQDNPNDTGGRWDDGNPHLILVRFVGSSKLSIWVDGLVTSITTSVPSAYGEGDLKVGTTAGISVVDEIMFFRVPPSEADVLTMAGWFLGTAAPLARETFAERIASLASLAGWTGTITDHSAAADPDLWGLGSVVAHPGTFGEGLVATTDSYGGALWATRTGTIRARTANALTSGTYASAYATAVGNLTNEASPAGSPTPIRRSVVQRTGARSDRLVTRATVTFGADGGLGVPSDTLVSTTATADSTYTTRYGIKSAAIESQCIVADTWAATTASAALVTTPPVEVKPLTVDVLDSATLDWVTDVGATGLGLEKLVTVTDYDAVSGATWTANLNVQGETFTWSDDGSLVVTIQLAASRVKTGRAKTASKASGSGMVVGSTAGLAPGVVTAKSLSPALKAALGLASPATSTTGITALTGDITASGAGSVAATIASSAVTTAKINDAAVTRAKLGVDAIETLIRTRVATSVAYTSGSADVTAAAGTFRSSDVGRSVFSDLTDGSGLYDPYISPGLVMRISSVLSDGSGATLNFAAVKTGTANMFIGGISATTTSDASRGLDVRADGGPWGVRVFTTETLTSSSVRSMMDMGFSHFMSVTVNGATASVPAPTGIGPAGLLATLYGAVRYTTASPNNGGTVSVLDTLTVQNSTGTYGNLLSSVLGFISQPYVTGTGSGGVVGFLPQLDAGGRIPAVQYWAQPVFQGASSGALNAFPVDSSGFETDTKVAAGALLGRSAGVKVVHAPIVAQAQVAASGGGELGLGSDLTAMSGATIRVSDCSSFPTAGTADVEVVDSAGTYMGRCKFTYTGKTGTTKLTGCTLYSDAVVGYIRAASARILLLAKQTTIHSSVTSTDVTTLSASTVKVTSTTDFGSSGTATVETVSSGVTTVGRFTYTSLTTSGGAPALGGCTFVSGVGNFTAGSAISYGGGVIKEQVGVLIEPMGRSSSLSGAAPFVYGWTPSDYIVAIGRFGNIASNLGSGSGGIALLSTAYAATPTIQLRRANGTQHAPTGVAVAEVVASIQTAGYTSSSAFSSGANLLTATAAQTFTSGAQGTYTSLWAVPLDAAAASVIEAWRVGQVAGAVSWTSVTTGSNVAPVINFWNNGDIGSKGQTLAADPLGRFDWYGATNAAGNPFTSAPVARIEVLSTENYTSTASGSVMRFQVTQAATTGTLSTPMQLTHPGSTGVAQARVGYLVVGNTALSTAATAGTHLKNTGVTALDGAVTAGSTLDVTGITTALGGLSGDTASGGNLTVQSTTHATRGIIKLKDRTTVGESVNAADTGNIATALTVTSAATNDDPGFAVGMIKSTTTNTSTKTIGKVPFTAGTFVPVVVYVTGHRSDTAEAGVFYRLEGSFKASTLNGSTPVLVGSITTTAITTDASVTTAPTLSVVSSEIVVQVKLNATENWSWACDVWTRPLDT